MDREYRKMLLDEISHQLMRLSQRMVEVHSRPKDFGCGRPLFPAEVHTLTTIFYNPDVNTTELAALLGVTKGAVSQMINKLEAKKLIIKRFAPGSEKQRMFILTSNGRKAHEGHEEYHSKMFEVIEEKMQTISVKDLEQYKKINSIVEQLIEELH